MVSTAGSPVNGHVPPGAGAFSGVLRMVSFSAFNWSTTASSAAPVGRDQPSSTQPGISLSSAK